MSEREKWIECFKAGTWTDAGGTTHEYTEEELQEIVDNYNNQNPETYRKAPLVYGHERSDSDPAIGWVEKLKLVGRSIFAYVTKLSKGLIEQIKDGAYDQVSIGMNKIGDEGWLLTHIAVLGAAQPAVGGMTPLSEYFAANKPTLVYDMDIPVKFANFTDGETILEARADLHKSTLEFEALDQLVDMKQNERSEKYQIGIKKLGNRVKPKGYAELSDDDFADPVHYRFPLIKKLIKSSLSNWSRDTVKEKYSKDEQEIINARILKAAADHGISLYKSIDNNLTNKGANMSQEQYDSFVSEFTQFLNDTFGEDVAQSIVSYLDTKKASLIVADAAATTDSNNSTPDDPQAKAFAEKEQMLLMRITQLENDGREKDFKAYLDKLIVDEKKLMPSQYDTAKAILNMGHKVGKVIFSENANQKEIDGIQLVKNFMESFKKIMEDDITPPSSTSTHSHEFSGMQVDEERMNQYNEVQNYINKQRAEGKEVTFSEAMDVVIKGAN